MDMDAWYDRMLSQNEALRFERDIGMMDGFDWGDLNKGIMHVGEDVCGVTAKVLTLY